uniref:DUF1618 domain-containing protein n=1 Tax=Aegilops tauschii TaxID=37682 RepID=M8C4W0_AEGTA
MSTAAVPSDESCRPGWVLLHGHAHIEKIRDETTAKCSTKTNEEIFASFSRRHPPLPSNLYVDCPGRTLLHPPGVLSMADDLILFNACVGSDRRYPRLVERDFFVYRAGPRPPSLKMLPRPHTPIDSIHEVVVVVPRGRDHYAIAALVPHVHENSSFVLHQFDSEAGTWISRVLRVDPPQEPFPEPIPMDLSQIFYHTTNCAITVGSAIGWVDLWRGIILWDMLGNERTLTGMPVPLPMKQIRASDASDRRLGHARYTRGISFINGSLRFVELQFEVLHLHGLYDEETGWPISETKSWTITTWNNRGMSELHSDWDEDCTLRASEIAVGDDTKSELSLLLRDGCDDHADAEQRGLQNLFVSDPHFGMNDSDADGDIIYLTARVKFLHPKSWILAIDMKNHRVQSVAMSAPLPKGLPCVDSNYCTCIISKCTN